MMWLDAYNAWKARHKDFLDQKSIWADGSENDLHQTPRQGLRHAALAHP